METQAYNPAKMPPAAVTAAETMTQAAQDAQASGKEDFMRIFLAQLKNQDPMEPLDNKDMVAQLAQLNGLEQAIETNRQLKALQDLTAGQSGTQMAHLIGKEVEAQGSQLEWDASADAPGRFAYTLHAPADAVTLTVRDAQGKTVQQISQPAPPMGMTQSIEWNGRSQGGQPAASGAYSVSLAAQHGKQSDALEVRLVDTARAVGFDAQGGGSVLLGGARVQPQSIVEVRGKRASN